MIFRSSVLAALCVAIVSAYYFSHKNLPTASPSMPEANERFDNPEAFAEQQWKMLHDPHTGEIPAHIRVRELAFAKRMNSQTATGLSIQSALDPWQSRGPNNLGGRTRAVVLDKNDQRIMIAGAAMGGMWRSTDEGRNWQRTTRSDQAHDVTCAVQDTRPGKSNIWYYGTGELLSTTNRRTSPISNTPRFRTTDLGTGIYKSVDSGKSWTSLSSTVIGDYYKLDSVFDGVWKLAIDPTSQSQDILYAACYGAIMRSSDGGTSWHSVLGDLQHKSYCTDVKITSTGVLYAAMSTLTADGSKSASAGVWRSVDGIHWSNITPPTWHPYEAGVVFAIAPSNENIVYLISETIGYGVSDHSVWKYTSNASSGTWQDNSQSLPFIPGNIYSLNSLGSYALEMAVKPGDPNTVYFGGTNIYKSVDGFATTGGVSWLGGYDVFNSHNPLLAHPDMHSFTFLKNDVNAPNAIIIGTDGGVYREDEPGVPPPAWQDLNQSFVSSLAVIVAMDHSQYQDRTLVTGFQDNGSLTTDTTDRPWNVIDGGDGAFCAIADHDSTFYTSSQFAFINRLHFENNQWNSKRINPDEGDNTRFLFINAFKLDPTNSNRMYLASTHTVLRNDDLVHATDSTQWTALSNITVPIDSRVSSLGISAADSYRLYYGTEDGHIYRIDDATKNDAMSIDVTTSNLPQGGYVSCLEVDSKDADRVVVTFSNYGIRSIFITENAGASWKDISGSLEQNANGTGDGPACRWAKIVNVAGVRHYYIGTSIGLYTTTDISQANVQWKQEGASTIGNYIVESIDARDTDGYIAVATQGAGVFSSVVQAPNSVHAISGNAATFSIFPNPANASITLDFPSAKGSDVTFRIRTITGELMRSFSRSVNRDYREILSTTSLPSGSYFLEAETSDAILRKAFTIIR